MKVSFDKIKAGVAYGRPELAEIWGYAGYQAISRGVVTPKGGNKIILFVTEEKQASAEQYKNSYSNGMLSWEGPNDHFAENRMTEAKKLREEIHLFHRKRHHSDFIYIGQLVVCSYEKNFEESSKFTFSVIP
jgi:putative restriction endonuclease